MNTRERALNVARRSPRVRRLLASTIQAAARIHLRVSVTHAEADALARDYLPTDAVDRIRRNSERRALQNLPDGYRDRGVVTTTILDGVTRRDWRKDSRDGSGGRVGEDIEPTITGYAARWTDWVSLKFRAWRAGRDIRADIENAHAAEQAQVRRLQDKAFLFVDSVSAWGDRIDSGIECLQLRVEYAAKLAHLGLSERQHEQAKAALDRTINYHLQFVLK